MSLRDAKEGAWTYELFADAFADPATCIITYCLPCVTYGQTAETVHGPAGSCFQHGLKWYLYGCICACGLVGGPTRKAIRSAYRLPAQPLVGNPDAPGLVNSDCITHSIPCVACFAACQEANELKARKPPAALDARTFDWAPYQPVASGPATTAPPVQPEMTKEAAPPAPPAAN